MKKFIGLFLTIILPLFFGCARSHDLFSQSKAEIEASVDRENARRHSNSIVDSLIKDTRRDLQEKMEKGIRDYYDEKSFGSLVDQMYATYGKLLEADYKMDETGWKTGPGGYSKPMRKFWYAIRTTKHERGSHYLIVEIVPDDGHLAGAGFAIVTFPLGAPTSLQ